MSPEILKIQVGRPIAPYGSEDCLDRCAGLLNRFPPLRGGTLCSDNLVGGDAFPRAFSGHSFVSNSEALAN